MEQQTLALRAYKELFGKEPEHQLSIRYSARFKPYGATVSKSRRMIAFRLSKSFHKTEDDIKIGVMQYLLTRLYKHKGETLEMQLYNTFIKKIGEWETANGAVIEDEELSKSFDRVNKKYFDSFMNAPHIKWGSYSTRQLGFYSFGNDTITLSTILRGNDDILDYVLYHELLHKKHKFEHRNGRTHSHTKEFRADEKKFVMSNGTEPEKALHEHLRTQKTTKKTTTRTKKKTVLGKLLDYF